MAIYDIVEIKKLALAELKKKHPTWKFESKTKKYSGGQSIYLTWTQGDVKMFLDGVEPQNLNIMHSPIYPSDNMKSVYTPEAISAFQEIFAEFNKYNWDRSDPMTDYFDVNFYMHFKVEKDYKYISSKKTTSSKTESTASQPKTSFNRGELIRECSGWKVYKKTLPDGRIVYNAVKDKETAPNKGDWNAIKGEIYIETGFKWGRFGAFEKWGEITESRGEQGVLDALCDILNKYYKSEETTTQTTTQTTTPETTPEEKTNFIINESYKSIPANPKLEYCKINWAEGIIGYSESFPKEFTSFTALTKYIADNIGQVPKVGYDKHGVEWKWKFEDESVTDRWDVSEEEANPLKYPNLYISERMQNWCYDAWAINPSQNVLHETDKFYSEKVGKDGSEINNEQFNNMLNGFLTYYEEDKKRFKYNTPESRLNAFKTAYPKIYALFQTEETANKKEQIQKAIAGLQILADKGNEKAQKAIIGLQYLLNK